MFKGRHFDRSLMLLSLAPSRYPKRKPGAQSSTPRPGVIVDKFNTDNLATSWAIEDPKPLGQFSRKFMSRIALTHRAP